MGSQRTTGGPFKGWGQLETQLRRQSRQGKMVLCSVAGVSHQLKIIWIALGLRSVCRPAAHCCRMRAVRRVLHTESLTSTASRGDEYISHPDSTNAAPLPPSELCVVITTRYFPMRARRKRAQLYHSVCGTILRGREKLPGHRLQR